jgi:hypothetical protein
MVPIRFPGFDEGDSPKSCQHCGRRKAVVRGGQTPRRFGFCLPCALDVLPAIIAAAVVAQARGQRRQQAVAGRGFRRLTEAYWGELRLDDDCLFPPEWVDGVERRVLGALTDDGGRVRPASGRTWSAPTVVSRPCPDRPWSLRHDV